ncbi:MAG TPA: M1 family metallopeptidase [Gemmatimonadales bacterium]
MATIVALVAAPVAAQTTGPRIQSYAFSLLLPDTGSSIRATAWYTFADRSSSDDTLRLNLVGLTVDSVIPLYGADAIGRPLPFVYDGKILRVRLTSDVYRSRLAVRYHGSPQDGLDLGVNAYGHRAVFGDNWPNRARYWLPTVDDPSGKAPVNFDVTVPAAWKVVSNGRLGRPGDASGTTAIWSWSERHPIPTYTMVFGAGEFTVSRHRTTASGVPITVWAYPEDSAFADSGPFRRATEIVETMERLVGPFPYEKLAHVESSTRYGGMENSSAIFYAEKPYVERTMREGVVRHETSHQWFGDAVTEREWAHLWLSEGFASYFDLVIGAALHGDSVLANGLARDARTYFTSQVVDRPLVDTAAHDPNKLLNENSYQKGAWVLHMLRGAIGDSAFFRGIREYYRVYRDSTALSSDFQRVMERAAGRSLDAFFQQWLWQPGYPRLEVRWGYEAADRRVRLEITEAQPEAWGVFRLPRLVVEAVSTTGTTMRRVYALDARTTIAYLELDAVPSAIRVDPDNRLLVQSTVTP